METQLIDTAEKIYTIYRYTNTVDGKIYIGQTQHSLDKRAGKGGCNYKNSTILYNAIQSYGFDKFKREIFVECDNQETADYLEKYYIEQYESRDRKIGYNLKEGGSAGGHLEKTKLQISETLKNKEWSEEEIADKARGGAQWKGKKRGPHTEEWKENNSIRTKEWHENNDHPMLGKHHTDEAKAKISASTKGKPRDPEAVKKTAKTRKMAMEKQLAIIIAYQENIDIKDMEEIFDTGSTTIYRILDEHDIPRRKSFKKGLGRNHTDITKAKMSQSAKDNWNTK